MDVYEAKARRDGNFWFVEIPELDLFTQARTIDEIEVMARDVIAISLEVPAESFGVRLSVSHEPAA
jgi:predicted RNase H-like HicB family nuclease